MTLAEQLNAYKVQVSFTRDEELLATAHPDNLDDLCNAEGEVTDPTFAKYLDWLDTVSFELEEHPYYGKDGGYVLVARTLDDEGTDVAVWDEDSWS